MEVSDGLAFNRGPDSHDDVADVEVHDVDGEIQLHDLLGKSRAAFAVINEYLHRRSEARDDAASKRGTNE